MAEAKKEVVGKVILLNVRGSFMSVFEPDKQKQDDGTIRETWKCNFLIPKDKADSMVAVYKGQRMPVLKALKLASAEAKQKKWGDEKNWPKLKPEKLFLRDGDLENWDGYPGCFYVSSSAPLSDRPAVVTNRKDGNNQWIEAQPGGKAAPYAGCYVNATVEIWCQDNEHGKRVNAKLKALQFYRDGEAFGAAPTNPNEDFTDDMAGDEGSFDEGSSGSDDDDDSGLV